MENLEVSLYLDENIFTIIHFTSKLLGWKMKEKIMFYSQISH